MRVAFVLPGIGVVPRGAEAFVLELGQALVERHGFEVTLFCRGPAPLPTVRIRALDRDTPWVNRIYRGTWLGKKILDTLFLDPLNLEWATASLSALPGLWRGRFDVVVMEGGLVGAWVARFLRFCGRGAFVDIAHGNSVKWETAFARQRPDAVVTFTADTARMLALRAPRARVVVIPHGVDLEAFTAEGPRAEIPLPRPVVLGVGALDENKRFATTVESVARLGRGSLVLLGDGPEAARIDELARRLLGPDRYLRRVLARAELPLWYRSADVFTLPSRIESFGLTYLEALACGTPVVATEDAVRREVIGEAGVLVDPADPAAYAAGLERALATDWGGALRRRAERFPASATADRYAELFRELVAS